ncbi:MAG TPA: ABC transporter substrate-binding protein, partial [Candidatus Eremiobacteraceae bacterium]|nr:ABC transporter substrate-binding protein [Candidatus Eremiobacteraceae bacterium]
MKLLSTAALRAGVLVALCAVAVGCSRVSTTSQPVGSQSIPGTLRYAVSGIGSLNPLTQTSTDEVILDLFVYGWFFTVDDTGRFVPDLALAVPTYRNGGISTDGRMLTYHLRRGVRWQDGAPFTARDVVFTVNAIMNPRNNVFSRTGWDDIASVETPDDFTVRFHLKRPYGPAIATLFCPYQHSGYPVLPAHSLAHFSDLNHVDTAVGTGPFKLKEWVRGDHIEFEANPLYWRGPPKLKRIVVKIVPDNNTALLQYKTHELDAIFNAPTAQFPQLKDLPDSTIRLVPTPSFELVGMNTRHAPLDDALVRRAIDTAIDKPKLIANNTHGVAMPAVSDIASSSWAFNRSLRPNQYDPAVAGALLEKAGWTMGPDAVRTKNGKRLTLYLTTIAKGADRVANEIVIQNSLRAVGIDAQVKNYPVELVYGLAAYGGVLDGGRYDLAVVGQNTGIDPDDSTLFMCDQFPPRG